MLKRIFKLPGISYFKKFRPRFSVINSRRLATVSHNFLDLFTTGYFLGVAPVSALRGVLFKFFPGAHKVYWYGFEILSYIFS